MAKEILEDKRFFLCSVWVNITFIWNGLKLMSLLNFISQTCIKVEEALTQKDISLCIYPHTPFPSKYRLLECVSQGKQRKIVVCIKKMCELGSIFHL